MPDKYQINILNHFNPHLIWMETEKPKHGDRFEQRGLYGVIPLLPQIYLTKNEIVAKKVRTWAPSIVDNIRYILNDAEDIFNPTSTAHKNSIFNINKFGKINLVTEEQIIPLSDKLCKTYFSALNDKIFLFKPNASKLEIVLHPLQTGEVITAVETILEERTTKKPPEKKPHALSELGINPNVKQNLLPHELNVLYLEGSVEMTESLCHKKLFLIKKFEEYMAGALLAPAKEDQGPEVTEKRSYYTMEQLQELQKWASDKCQNNYNYKCKYYGSTCNAFPRNETARNDLINSNFEPKENSKDASEDSRSKPIVTEKNKEAHTNVANDSEVKRAAIVHNTNTEGYKVTLKNMNVSEFARANVPKSKTDHSKLSGNNPEETIFSTSLENIHIKNCTKNNVTGPSMNNNVPCHNDSTLTIDGSAVTNDNVTGPSVANNVPCHDDSTLTIDGSPIMNDVTGTSMYNNIPSHDDSTPIIDGSPVMNGQVTDTSMDNNVPSHDDSTPTMDGSPVTNEHITGTLMDNNVPCHDDSIPTIDGSAVTNDNVAGPSVANNVPCHADSTLTIDGSVVTNDNITGPSMNNNVPCHDSIPTTDGSIVTNDNVAGPSVANNVPSHDDSTPTICRSTETNNITASNVCHVNVFQNIDANILNLECNNRFNNAVLMVHTKSNIRIQPTIDFRDIQFSHYIKSILNDMHISRPMVLQTVSWPCILKGDSLFMISPRGCGKSFGFIPPVCHLVLNNRHYECKGPRVIIICATAQSVINIENKFRALLRYTRTIISYFVGKNEIDVHVELHEGCDVFITTPCGIVRFLNNSRLNLKDLEILVLENCERIDKVYIREVKYLLLKIDYMLRDRLNNGQSVQYILTSTIWCTFMEDLAKKAVNSVISISAIQESVIYSKAHTSVNFVESVNKIEVVTNFLTQIDISRRTLIVCRTDDEVKCIQETLQKLECNVFVGDTNMTVENLSRLKVQYDASSKGAVLLCCDKNLEYLNVTNASYLIIYTLPNRYLTFSKCLAALTDNYASIFNDTNSRVKIKILIDRTVDIQLPKILNLIKRFGIDPPELLVRMSEKIMTQNEYLKAKTFTPVCDKLLSFGECANYWDCEERHWLFTDFDTPPEWIPTRGVVCFQILDYRDAVTYKARLISHSINGNNTEYPNTYVTTSMKINLHFLRESNKILLAEPKLGDICIVAIDYNQYKRCQIIKILSNHQNINEKDVFVKFLDEPGRQWTRDANLYVLPARFNDFISYIVQVKLAGLLPKDRDLMFSDLAIIHLNQYANLQEILNEDMFVRANIVTAIGNTIIVDSLIVRQRIRILKEVVVRYDFKKELLSKHACINENHVPKLKELLAKCHFVQQQTLPEPTSTHINVRKQRLAEPRWAHMNADEITLVHFGKVESPGKFFFRLNKFEDCLRILSRDIEEYVKALQPSQCIHLGDYVIAQSSDDKVFRARIDNTDSTDNTADCFLVDYGFWKSFPVNKLFAITDKFVTQLPFQAIECRLAGLKPVTESLKHSYWKIVFPTYLMKKELSAKYIIKEKSESTGGNKYAVVITSGVNGLSINREILQKRKFVAPIDDEIQLLNDFFDSSQICNKDENVKWSHQTPLRSIINALEDDDCQSDEFDVQLNNDEISKLLGFKLRLP